MAETERQPMLLGLCSWMNVSLCYDRDECRTGRAEAWAGDNS
jgi:hypothetical protein